MPSRPSEFSSLVKLAIPVVLTQLANLALQLVDSLMVGRAGANQLAGLGAGMAVFHIVMVAGLGFLFALDTTVSQALGAGNRDLCRKNFFQGLWAAGALSVVLIPVQLMANKVWAGSAASDPQVLAAGLPYLQVLTYSYPLFLFGIVIQRYLQAIGIVAPMVWITVAGNILNYFANLWTIFGKPEWGIPALGAEGAAWATLVSRLLILLASAAYLVWLEPALRTTDWRFDKKLQKELFSLGWPAGAHFAIEVGAFAGAALIASTLGAIPMAAHHVVITIASFTFMIPLGVSSATAVRVGYHIGAGRRDSAIQVGWFGIGISAAVMACSGLTLLVFPEFFLGRFTGEAAVIELGRKILFLAALFQIFDGIQVAAGGALRGISDTRSPALANLIGHYPIGLAAGAALCFGFGMGLHGIWIGLTLGLFSVATMLLIVWRLRSKGASHPAILKTAEL